MLKSLSVLFTIGGLCVCLSLSKSFAAEVAKAGVPAGQKIFLDNKCTQCHAIDALKISKAKADKDEEEEEASEGGKKVDPPDLSDAGKNKDHDAAWFSKWLMKEEKVEGRKHKKKFKGSPEELKTVSEWLTTLKYDAPKKKDKAGKKEKESSDE